MEAQDIFMEIVEKVYSAPAATDVLGAPSSLLGALMIQNVCPGIMECFSFEFMLVMFYQKLSINKCT